LLGGSSLASLAPQLLLEQRGKLLARQPLPGGVAQGQKLVALASALGAAGDVTLHFHRRANLELVVDPWTDQSGCLRASHAVSFRRPPSLLRSCARARERRDNTVSSASSSSIALDGSRSCCSRRS